MLSEKIISYPKVIDLM